LQDNCLSLERMIEDDRCMQLWLWLHVSGQRSDDKVKAYLGHPTALVPRSRGSTAVHIDVV
jgi:hypothetical protein